VRVAAAASTRRSASAETGAVVLDVAGRRVALDRRAAELLQAATTDEAGRSSVARDLSLLLAEGLRGRTLALRRGEASTLARIAAAVGLADVAGELTPA